ncbi:MAG TPA: twin-arginine translocase TatA/TatE family subunit [Thermoguttaceae bacterium]|nr:twin-arginine translocase TatA/TatE family subunit [Thermoguttaceae bacterium]
MTPLFGYFGIGTTELLVIAILTLILFGNRLPSVMRSLGRGVVEFKKGIQGIEDDLESGSTSDGKKSEQSTAKN